MVCLAASLAHGQARPLADLNAAPARRSSGVRVLGRFGDGVLLVINDRYGRHYFVTDGTPQTTRPLGGALTSQVLTSLTPEFALFQNGFSGTELIAFTPDGGARPVIQPALPGDGGTFWYNSKQGIFRGEHLVRRCGYFMSTQVCDMLAVRGSGSRLVADADVFGGKALSLGNKLLSPLTLSNQWLLFDGASWSPLGGLPPSSDGVATAVDSDRAFLVLAQRAFVVSADGGTRELLPALLSPNVRTHAVTPGLALVADNFSTQLIGLNPGGGRVNLGSCRTPSAVASDGRIFLQRSRCSDGIAPTFDAEPWLIELDGGISQIRNLNLGGDSFPHFFDTALANKVFFSATRSLAPELWVSDGTALGTLPLGFPLGPSFNRAAAGTDRFIAFNAAMPDGTSELGLTDGSPAGTHGVDLTPGTVSSSPGELLGLSRHVVALTTSTTATNTLVSIDVVDGGVAVWLRGAAGDFGKKATFGSSAALVFDDHVHGSELWLGPAVDGGAELVDLNQGTAGSLPNELTASGGRFYFAATDVVAGRELWSSKGSAATTARLKDVHQGPASSNPQGLAAVAGGVFFFADDGLNGTEPWFSDGTPEGTLLLADVFPGAASSGGGSLVAAEDLAWFAADDGRRGLELWTSDGTAAGTSLVFDGQPGRAGSNPVPRLARARELLFTTNLPTGRALAVTDGTPSGLRVVRALGPEQFEAVAASRASWFFALGEGDVHTLWRSEGTAATTRQLFRWTSPVAPWLHVAGDEVIFNGASLLTGTELWMSEPGDAGVRLLQDLAPGFIDSWPGVPAQVGTRLVFAATDVNDDREPWVFQLPEALDNTPPQVTAQIVGAQRQGWFVGATSIGFQVEDPDSTLLAPLGCEARDVLEEGIVTRTCVATSAGGTTELPVVLRRDFNAPVVSCPEELTFEATTDAGSLVTFVVVVTDTVDPAPLLRVTPPPNTLFPLGRTRVSATATDTAGHVGACFFDVVVLPEPRGEPTTMTTTTLRPTGCGCSSADGSLWAALALLMRAARGRRLRGSGVLLAFTLLAAGLASAAPRPKPKATPRLDTSVAQAQSADEALLALNSLYAALEYERVVTSAAELLVRSDLPLDVRVEAYRLQGCARAIVADPVDAEQPFRLLLRAQPGYELPDSTPPKILAVFRKVQSEERALASTLKEVERRRLVGTLKLIGEGPAQGTGGQPLMFSWRVRDPLSVVETVEVPWRKSGQRSFSTLSLERTQDGSWRGVIAPELTADERGFALEYFVRTADAEGPLLVQGAESTPFTVNILPGTLAPVRVKPVPASVFWTTVVVTATAALLGAAFSLALPFQQQAYRDGALAGRPGLELVGLANEGGAFATTANIAWATAGATGLAALVMLPFTRFDGAAAAAP